MNHKPRNRVPLRAVTFDFWGTLFAGQQSWRAQRVAALCRMLPDCDPTRATAAYQQAEAVRREFSLQGFTLSSASSLCLTLDALETTLLPDVRVALLRAWEEAVLPDPPSFLEGVPEAVRRLHARGLVLGLISDTAITPGRVLRQLLARGGLLALFTHCTFSDELGVTKRHPQAFTATLAALGVQPAETLHVGDMPETDLQTARRVGLRTALVLEDSHRTDGIPLADLVLAHTRDLPEAIESW